MKHDSLDVELLRFFRALIDTGALSRAACRLEMSQPAASRALGRLRALMNDPLFVKCGLGMAPTPRALALRPQVEELLSRLEAMSTPDWFDPKKSERAFRIALADNGFLTFLGRVLPTFLEQAPHAHIDVVQLESDVLRLLSEGRLDAGIFPASDLPPDFHRRELLCSDYVCLMRRDHPLTELADGRPPTPEEIDRYPRMTVRYNWGLDVRSIEERARAPISSREPTVSTPYFVGAPLLLLDTDLVIVLPRPTAERFCEVLPLAILPTPVPFQPFRPCLIWHHRVHADPAMQWFRGLFLSPTGLHEDGAAPVAAAGAARRAPPRAARLRPVT